MARTTDATPSPIDAVLAALPDDQRRALQGLRESIAAAAPDAVEAMSYGAPAFRYRDHPLVSFNAATQHCALYVMSPAVIAAHEADLQGFDTTKGAIRFTPERPLPDDLVAKLVRARMAETDERWG
jgi:uncharacterized protein YdhG (YjbR/CyaY superfamily)